MATPIGKSVCGRASGELASTLVALLRTEGHLCNVLTHISSGDWSAVERAIKAILEPRTSAKRLSPLARNMLELLCDNGGVAGRIMRPFFFAAIARIAGKAVMKRLDAKIRRLRARMSSAPLANSARRSPRQVRDRQPAQQARVRPFSTVVAAPGMVTGAHS